MMDGEEGRSKPFVMGVCEKESVRKLKQWGSQRCRFAFNFNVGGVGREFDQLDDCVSDPKQRSVPLFILNKEIYLPY